MNKLLKLLVIASVLAIVFAAIGCGDGSTGTETAGNTADNAQNAGEKEAAEKFSEGELDNLLAPIALYPDPLLAQVLPASTFPDDVATAAKYVKSNGKEGIDDQDWPVAVKSVAYYPDALYELADDSERMTAIGQAYTLQPNDVLDSIQRLRLRAYDNGALRTSKELEVVRNDGNISLYPAQPEYLYVPRYQPQEVYYESGRSGGGGDGLVSSLVKFGAGVATGLWLNNMFDWGGRRVYYHGWRDDNVWVVRTRDHYRWDDNYYRDSYYVNDRYRTIYVNRDIIYAPVRYDRIRVYDAVFPGVTYKNRRYKEVPGLGDEMRRQDPGRPIEKGPPPGQIKKDKYDDRGGPPAIDSKKDRGNPGDRGGSDKGSDKGRSGGNSPAKGGKDSGPAKGKGKPNNGGSKGKGKN